MHVHVSVGALLLAVASCQRTPPAGQGSQGPAGTAAAAVSVAPASADSAKAPSSEAPPRAKARQLERAQWRPGLAVSALGKISDVPWQHVMGSVPGKNAEYFDLSSDMQTVIYVAGPIECAGQVEVEGRVMEVSAGSKRASKTGEERYAELHLDVTSYRCVP